MKLYSVTLAFVALCAPAAVAQDASKLDLFVGYSYLRENPEQNFKSFAMNGGLTALSYNLTEQFAIESEFGGYHSGGVNGVPFDSTSYNYLFGPKWSIGGRSQKVIPFVHVLWGVNHFTTSILSSNLSRPTATPPIAGQAAQRLGGSRTGFNMVAGGGVDIQLNKRFLIRPAQVDYYLTDFTTPDYLIPSTGFTPPSASSKQQGNFRFSAGIVFKFGSR
jgi:hypothetical protein